MEKAAMKKSKASSSTASGMPTFSYPAAIALMKNQRKYSKKTREEVLKGKNIRVDKNGFENFDDYFTDSDADKTKPKNVSDVKNSKKDHLEQKLHSGKRSTTENDIPFNSSTKRVNKSPQKLTNGVEKRANESKSARTMKKLKSSLPVPVANRNKIVVVDLTGIPNSSPPSSRKNSRNGSSGFSPSKIKLEIEESSEILTRNRNKASANLSTPTDSGVSKLSSKSKSPEKLSPVSPNTEKVACNATLERALSPCKIYLNDVCKVKEFVEREENCIINFDTGNSSVKDKPDFSSPKKKQKLKTKDEEDEPLVEGLDVVELKNHKLSPGKNHPTPKTNFLDSIFDLKQQVKMLENCKNMRLEIDPLPETISIIVNSQEQTINQKSEDKLVEYRKTNKAPQPDAQVSPKRRIVENVQIVLNDIRTNPTENDLENQLVVPDHAKPDNEKLVESCYDKQKDLSDEKRKSVKNSTGGKHFLPKRTVSTRQRRSILREKSDATDSDTDETSESDGHIYLPSKPSNPKPRKLNGNNEDLAVPSTSGWKPPKKKSRKAKSEMAKNLKVVSEKPKKPQILSTIMEVEENRQLQPVVCLRRLDLTRPNVPKDSQPKRNQNKNVSETNVRKYKLVSALKGNKLKSKRLSVSFKEEPISLDSTVWKKDYPPNFLPLNTPEINTPNARRSKRKRIPRLNLGLNQRVVYQQKGNDLIAVAIDLGSEIPGPKPRKTVKKNPANDRSLSIHFPLNEGNTAAINAPPMVLDLENNNETEYDLYTKKDSITWFGPSAEESKMNDPYVIAKMVDQNKFSAGYLKLRGGCEKPHHELWDSTLVFVIIKGKILVEIHNSQLIMESQETFTVPKGNSYHLKNLRRDEAKLWFTSYKD